MEYYTAFNFDRSILNAAPPSSGKFNIYLHIDFISIAIDVIMKQVEAPFYIRFM